MEPRVITGKLVRPESECRVRRVQRALTVSMGRPERRDQLVRLVFKVLRVIPERLEIMALPELQVRRVPESKVRLEIRVRRERMGRMVPRVTQVRPDKQEPDKPDRQVVRAEPEIPERREPTELMVLRVTPELLVPDLLDRQEILEPQELGLLGRPGRLGLVLRVLLDLMV